MVKKSLLLFSLALNLCSCGHLFYLLKDPIPPKVKLNEIKVKSVSLTQMHLEAILEIKNPNEFDLVSKNLSYRIMALGKVVAQGDYAKKLIIPESESHTVKLPLLVSSANAMKMVGRVIRGKKVEVSVAGDGVFDSDFGDIELNFSKKMSIP